MVDAVEAGDGDGMGGVEMHHGARLGTLAIHGEVQEAFLGGIVAIDKLALIIQLRQPCRVEAAQ